MLLILILSTSGYDQTNERWRKVGWQKRRTSSWEWSRARGTEGGRLRTCRLVWRACDGDGDGACDGDGDGGAEPEGQEEAD